MSATSRRAKSAHWPVWLLFAAWICANSPQAVTYDLIVWARGAGHFSHQERLKADVAFLLAGRKLPPLAQSRATTGEKPAAPPVPAEAVLKKIDLYAVFTVELAAPPWRSWNFPRKPDLALARARSRPLLPPPRGRGVA